MEKALENVKGKLTHKPVLFAPDFKREFIVQTDASDLGVGVILTQRINGEEHPILYLSRKFSGPEKRYSATERECAAIIFAIKKLRYYLDGQKFKIETDHNPLVWLKTNAGNNPRLMSLAVDSRYPWSHDVTLSVHFLLNTVTRKLDFWHWEILPHPSYSPDLAPCDFHLLSSVVLGFLDLLSPTEGAAIADGRRLFLNEFSCELRGERTVGIATET
ncbi:Retrovirus-related Pol polyprotein from transposon 297 [Araneus ventricosus]|uniref:Retrovirus-related Pol polyprotein from transposon 297 n=1 Tax=Araneus ventricosus TaxID=182803 RepID=A0A4Y2TDY5_ARAVE|nr:Retrovirus-related Pol polyprotein from transposon 297 [Araneus ventricosus]